MDDYEFQADGTVLSGRYGPAVAFFDDNGRVYDKKYGNQIGHVAPDGTVREDSQYGKVLGKVGSDGTVQSPNGAVVGRVQAPAHKRGALLLLLG